MAEWSIATDCKSVALRATQVRILPGAPAWKLQIKAHRGEFELIQAFSYKTMSNKYSRAGKKFSGNHTTLTPLASSIADIAQACPTVTKISPGFIKAGLKPVQGKRRLKVTDFGTALLLSIRDNTSHQEIYVYATDKLKAKDAIVQGAEAEGILVTHRPLTKV